MKQFMNISVSGFFNGKVKTIKIQSKNQERKIPEIIKKPEKTKRAKSEQKLVWDFDLADSTREEFLSKTRLLVQKQLDEHHHRNNLDKQQILSKYKPPEKIEIKPKPKVEEKKVEPAENPLEPYLVQSSAIQPQESAENLPTENSKIPEKSLLDRQITQILHEEKKEEVKNEPLKEDIQNKVEEAKDIKDDNIQNNAPDEQRTSLRIVNNKPSQSSLFKSHGNSNTLNPMKKSNQNYKL